MRNLKLTLAYDGTDFYGWQIQPELATIQGELERVVAQIEGQPVKVHGAGRTDAGVHALAQTASFTLENPIPVANLRRAMNRLLPPAIRVIEVAEAAPEFHARFSARAKLYQYRLWRGEICSPHEVRYVYHHPYPLDLDLMREAASRWVGEHDFRSLAAADETADDAQPRVRTVFSSRLEIQGELVRYTVRGTGFLRHMVRNMVGTLLAIGQGRLTPQDIPRILAAADRTQAGPTAPARGLFLVEVEY